eukprot:TRINITY_DN2432_c0_g1_i1.p1 TRINITY_DN2432_c0_g1~~TRINITY_DN2432_c0_g1_i1.p1  ORF type:complete len:329 (+),score=81.56 TRINITY_DN2432_c0_g1_i1:119-1105(+)
MDSGTMVFAPGTYESSTMVRNGSDYEQSSVIFNGTLRGTMRGSTMKGTMRGTMIGPGSSATVNVKQVFGSPTEIEKEPDSEEFNGEASFGAWLNFDRTKRELLFQINTHMAKIKAGFSYLRMEGLNEMMEFLHILNEDEIAIFLAIQDFSSSRYKNVACEVFGGILHPPRVPKLSPISSQEIEKALEILQILFTIHPTSMEKVASDNDDALVKVLLDVMDIPNQQQIQVLALNILQSIISDIEINQEAFSLHSGLDKVLNVFRQKKAAKDIRIKCVEIFDLVLKDFIYDNSKNQKKLEEALGVKAVEVLTSEDVDREKVLEIIDRTPH